MPKRRDYEKARDGVLRYWSYDRLISTKDERAAWLEFEAQYIKGMIHRATRKPLDPQGKILQIGAGPCDVIDHWHEGEKHAIDPYAEEFKQTFHEFQDPGVKYIAGFAEDMPYEDNYFDVVIIRNALDHFDDPFQALREVFRVIKPTGALYVWIFIYSRWASLAIRTLSTLTKAFEAEPWGFTWRRINKCLSEHGFVPCLPAIEDRPKSINIKKENPSIADRLKPIAKVILDLTYDKGFTCVALPQKGEWKPWRLPS